MARFIRSPQAARDVLEIVRYIRKANPPAARKVLAAIDKTIRFLGEFPTSGRERPELGAEIRSAPAFRYRKYVVFYRIRGDVVEIVRVLHGARELRRQFRQPP